MRHSHVTIAALIVLAIVAAGCAARSAYSKGDTAARAGDWDAAVEQYRKALQEDPQNVRVQDRLRAGESQRGRHAHRRRATRRSARTARSGSDGVPSRERVRPRQSSIAGKVLDLERKLRDQIEQSRPRPSAQQLRQAARAGQAPPLFNFNSVVQPIRFQQASLRDIFNFVGEGDWHQRDVRQHLPGSRLHGEPR